MEEKIETACSTEQVKVKTAEDFRKMFLENIRRIKETKKVEAREPKISLAEIVEKLKMANETQE